MPMSRIQNRCHVSNFLILSFLLSFVGFHYYFLLLLFRTTRCIELSFFIGTTSPFIEHGVLEYTSLIFFFVLIEATGNGPSTPQRVSSNAGPKANSVSSVAVPNAVVPKRNSVKATSTFNNPIFNKSDVIPVIVPRTNSRHEQDESRKDFDVAGRAMPLPRTNSRHEQDDSRKDFDVAGRAMPLPRTNSRHEQDDSRKELDVAGRAMPLTRTNSRHEQDDSRKELDVAGRAVPAPLLSKTTDTNRRFPSGRDEVDNSTISILSESRGLKAADMSNIADNRNSLHGIGSIQGVSAPQKIVKEERHIGSGKNETETKESTASYKHEGIICYIM